MPSLVAWLDSTPEEQKAARELIAMFSEKESRDELGIGPIRDAFSDLLFPGTSVLQTRARYYLFVPWCYSTPVVRRLSGTAHRDRGRGNERTLIKTLQAADSSDKTGLIGARAGVKVLNLPSDIYWGGMLRYGVREHPGAIGSLTVLPKESDAPTELADRALVEWSATIPPAPPGFPERLDGAFSLTPPEAQWLRERMLGATGGTLLAHLLERGERIDPGVSAPWLAASETDFDVLLHARMFSTVMQGAALLYNALIAKRYEDLGLNDSEHSRAEEYDERLTDWHTELLRTDRRDLQSWDLEAMWRFVRSRNPNVAARSQTFVNGWIQLLRQDADPSSDASMRQLVREREMRKGAQSRLRNEKMLAAWSGASGTGLMTYRWGTVKGLVNDIVDGLNRAGA